MGVLKMKEYEKKLSRLTTNDFTIHKNKVWFYNRYYGGIFTFKLDDFLVEREFTPSESEELRTFLFHGIECNGEKVACAPNFSSRLLLYDLDKKSADYVDFDIKRGNDYITNYFKYVFAVGDNFYFIPGRYEAILKLNMNTRKVSYIDIDLNGISVENNYSSIIFASKYDGNRYIYMTGMRKGTLWILDTFTDEVNRYDLISQGIKDFIIDKNLICFLTEDHKICFFDKDTEEHYSLDIGMKYADEVLRYLFLYRDSLYIVPLSGRVIIKYNTEDKSFCEALRFENEMSVVQDCNGVNIVACKKISDNKLLMFNDETQQAVLFGFEDNSVEKHDLRMQIQDAEYITDLHRSNLINEGQLSLEDFIDIIEKKGSC